MLVTRTPLRITLGGGGTDDPKFVAEHGGFCLTAAINKHIYIGLIDTFAGGYLLKYAETEHVRSIDEIRHPFLREALRYFEIPPHVEIVSMADIPAGTGLGSSGGFGVGLCLSLATYCGQSLNREEAAELAAHIELDLLGRPGGKQDHWACALGGVAALSFQQDGSVGWSAMNPGRVEKHLALYFTGFARDADKVLSAQTRHGLDEIKAAGIKAAELLMSGDIESLGLLMNEHWTAKKTRSPDISNERIDHLYEIALANGAYGGKLVGAGGGGFLLFVVRDRKRLNIAMTREGLRETPISFEPTGATVVANDR